MCDRQRLHRRGQPAWLGCFDTLPTDEQIADLLADRQPDWWICRGCGTRIDARTGPDLVVGHVRDCDLVDGAGNPIGGPR